MCHTLTASRVSSVEVYLDAITNGVCLDDLSSRYDSRKSKHTDTYDAVFAALEELFPNNRAISSRSSTHVTCLCHWRISNSIEVEALLRIQTHYPKIYSLGFISEKSHLEVLKLFHEAVNTRIIRTYKYNPNSRDTVMNKQLLKYSTTYDLEQMPQP